MNFIDLTDKKFNRLMPIKCVGKNKYGQSLWLCKCSCGQEKIIVGASLRSGLTQSCGCLQKEKTIKSKTRHYKISRINKTTVIASCHKHGICIHITNKKNNGLRCGLCSSFYNKERNQRKEIKEKTNERARRNSRKWLENPINNLANKLRKRVRQGLNRISNKKINGCFRNLDYTPLQLYNYLENIKRLQNNECPYCKISYDKCKVSIDHIIPLEKAKTEEEIINLFDLKNLNLMCKSCNSSKNDNNLREWCRKKKFFNNCVLDDETVIES